METGKNKTPRPHGAKEAAGKKRLLQIAAAVGVLAALALAVCLMPRKEKGGPDSSVSAPGKTELTTGEKLAAAIGENPDVVGWLTLSGAEVDDPVVQGADNEVYLRRPWNSTAYDIWGCYFLDYICKFENGSPTDRVSIIYGHALDDESESEKFSKLKRYADPAFCAANPAFTLTVPDGAGGVKELRFAVVSTCTIPVYADGAGYDYIDPNPGAEKHRATLDYMLTNSTFAYGVEVTVEDRLMILSTCTADETVRFVVVGKLVEEAPAQ